MTRLDWPDFYFARHGETDWNRERRYQGTMDIPLNATGRLQADANGVLLRELLERDNVDPVSLRWFASPLGRAAETMERLRAAFVMALPPVVLDPRLIELSFGSLEGRLHSEITREAPPDGPQLADRGKRLVAVLLDGLVNLVAVGPGIAWGVMSFAALAGNGSFGPTHEAHSFGGMSPEMLILKLAGPALAILVPLLAILIVQTWLLTSRGQTLGKMWMRIRIVRTDGSNPGFVHAILLRAFAMQLIGFVPLVGGAVSLIDPCLIFREDRRCLHDLLADTTVIDA